MSPNFLLLIIITISQWLPDLIWWFSNISVWLVCAIIMMSDAGLSDGMTVGSMSSDSSLPPTISASLGKDPTGNKNFCKTGHRFNSSLLSIFTYLRLDYLGRSNLKITKAVQKSHHRPNPLNAANPSCCCCRTIRGRSFARQAMPLTWPGRSHTECHWKRKAPRQLAECLFIKFYSVLEGLGTGLFFQTHTWIKRRGLAGHTHNVIGKERLQDNWLNVYS